MDKTSQDSILEISENELLILFNKGNQLAFNEVYNRFWKRLYAYVHNILNDHMLTEDVLQEVFTNIWAKKGQLEIKDLKSYLFNSVRNRAISKIRRNRFSKIHEEAIENLSLPSEVEQQLAYNDLRCAIDQETQKLPKRCRTIFYLSRYQHYSISEIANQLDISHRTVENQLYRALKHLRSTLGNIISLVFLWPF